MKDITHIVLLFLSAAVILTTHVQAEDGSEEDRACAKLMVATGLCTSYNETSNLRYEGACPYIFRYDNIIMKFRHHGYCVIIFNISTCSQLNEAMCGQLNREGLLCSKCKAGYGPDLYSRSSSCVPCNEYSHLKWILYFVLLLTPLTIFFLIVIIFNVRATSPPFTAFVFFCQLFTNIYKLNPSIRMYIDNFISPYVYKLVFTLIDVWSLDFFRHLIPPFCVSSSISNTQVLMLEFIPPFYLLILIILTYMLVELHARNVCVIVQLWRPFNKYVAKVRRTYDSKASIFNAFATFVLLSFSNILFSGIHFTYMERVYIIQQFLHKDRYIHRLYYDPNISAVTRVLPIIILVLGFSPLPILLLCLYPIRSIRRILYFICCKDIRCLKSFVDAFQGHYKDGTNGTRDYRVMASLQFISRTISLTYSYWKSGIDTHMRYEIILLICLSFIYTCFQPCKKKFMNNIEGFLYGFAAILCSLLGTFVSAKDIEHEIIMYLILLLILLPSIILMLFFIKKLVDMLHLESINYIYMQFNKHLFKRKKGSNYREEESFPHRLIFPNEYSPLM